MMSLKLEALFRPTASSGMRLNVYLCAEFAIAVRVNANSTLEARGRGLETIPLDKSVGVD